MSFRSCDSGSIASTAFSGRSSVSTETEAVLVATSLDQREMTRSDSGSEIDVKEFFACDSVSSRLSTSQPTVVRPTIVSEHLGPSRSLLPRSAMSSRVDRSELVSGFDESDSTETLSAYLGSLVLKTSLSEDESVRSRIVSRTRQQRDDPSREKDNREQVDHGRRPSSVLSCVRCG